MFYVCAAGETLMKTVKKWVGSMKKSPVSISYIFKKNAILKNSSKRFFEKTEMHIIFS